MNNNIQSASAEHVCLIHGLGSAPPTGNLSIPRSPSLSSSSCDRALTAEARYRDPARPACFGGLVYILPSHWRLDENAKAFLSFQ
jgi:hypothetical protein